MERQLVRWPPTVAVRMQVHFESLLFGFIDDALVPFEADALSLFYVRYGEHCAVLIFDPDWLQDVRDAIKLVVNQVFFLILFRHGFST